jgi:rare lipoprotein A (peptidoglycan hydrolase)
VQLRILKKSKKQNTRKFEEEKKNTTKQKQKKNTKKKHNTKTKKRTPNLQFEESCNREVFGFADWYKSEDFSVD